jgi:hypothetical protein
LCARFPNVTTTPFGAPVEPEVYLVAHSTVVYIALV